MKKVIVCLSVYMLAAYPQIIAPVKATEPVQQSVAKQDVKSYIAGLYQQIQFGQQPLDFEVFEKAMHGYLNLRNAGKLNADKNLLTICDFTHSSKDARFWIIDLQQKKVMYHTYVAHGQGSGEEFARLFSNNNESHQSSLGFYVTGETYMGGHGLSLRLHGMDNGYNSAAYDRGIVVHGAEYVCDNFVKSNNRLGRSWGCPAVPAALSSSIINTIKDGTCLFIYYPEKAYLQTAYWLNKNIDKYPGCDANNTFRPQLAQVMDTAITTLPTTVTLLN